MIKFENVTVQYVADFYSLLDFNLTIENNTLLIGDFFDGTTAIFRTLSKIDKHYKGDIFIDGVNIKTIKDKDLNLCYLPKIPTLFKNKNILNNLYFPLKIRKINKKSAKNLIYSVFFELKNKNFNIFENYLNIKNNKLKNKINSNIEDIESLKIEQILKLKTKKLTLSEQKILCLIRAVLRKPKYVIIENLFEDLDEKHIQLANFLIEKLSTSSTIIATETNNAYYKNFKVIDLTKKED